MPETLTLYTASVCPYAQRVELALSEAKAPFTRFEVDLQNKPEWYAPKVNPASKVPAIAYGGPQVPPDQPSPESTKIAESLVLLEFVADLYPDSGLLPKDPVLRAKARFFIDAVSNKFNPAFFKFVFRGEGTLDEFVAAIKEIQALLPAEGYAIGPFSIADLALIPFWGRGLVAFENDLGGFAVGEGPKYLEAIKKNPELTRFLKYVDDVTSRPSFKATFVPEVIKARFKERFRSGKA
ncbi:glutathione S-transferase C-terminal-like protein [Abortiporus biennis]|nr:glutathione S-transferase C-terminal-like protein [Abortiporus biennis]